MGYHLLTENQAKMLKAREFGYYSVVLHLEPAYEYKGQNTCPWAGQCKAYCLGNSGRMRFDSARAARIRRTELFYDDRNAFITLLHADILAALRRAEMLNLKLSIRLNGTSDIAWEGIQCGDWENVMLKFPDVQFIDYTKSSERALASVAKIGWPKNYTVVYSRNERSDQGDMQTILRAGGRVAVVFDSNRGDALPKAYRVNGRLWPVVDGDVSDLRHLDPRGCIVGLRYKLAFAQDRDTGVARALKPKRGFIVLNDREVAA